MEKLAPSSRSWIALKAIMKDQVDQLNKVGVPATAIDIKEEAEKKQKV